MKIKFVSEEAKALYAKHSEVQFLETPKEFDYENSKYNGCIARDDNKHAGFQLIATSVAVNDKLQTIIYGTGICVETKQGYIGDIRPRSSIYKKALSLCNGIGTIEDTYRGELILIFRYLPHVGKTHNVAAAYIDLHELQAANLVYNVGDNIGQLIVLKNETDVIFEIVDELSTTVRGENGFGSTGN
jgi:dUTP pyrophosphatase